jgi:hypothetical protein
MNLIGVVRYWFYMVCDNTQASKIRYILFIKHDKLFKIIDGQDTAERVPFFRGTLSG